MVAVFLRLRFRQFANASRRPPAQLLGLVILAIYGIAATAYAVRALIGLSTGDPVVARVVVVVAGCIITLGFILVPIFFGADDPADPRAFGAIGLTAGQITTGLTISSFLNLPVLLLAVVAVTHALTWTDHPHAVVVAWLSAALVISSAAIGARLARSAAAFWLRTRRVREIFCVIGFALVLLATPVIVQLASAIWGGRRTIAALKAPANLLAETPLGAAWAAPVAAAAGDSDTAWWLLLIALLFVFSLWFCWRILVGRMIVSTRHEPAAAARSGLGWFAVLPGTPAGAIAARGFTYWLRDRRYRLSLIVIPVVAIVLTVPFLLVGVWWQNLALIPLPIMCLFLAWTIHNDTASDNTAMWLHIAAHTSGWADRFGRTVPVLIVGLPLIALGAPATTRLYGVPEVLPSVLGVCLCILLSGLGLSSYVSARLPYATVRPGDSPFAQPQSTSSSPGQAISFFGTIALALPAMYFAGMGLASDPSWHLVALGVGLGVGCVSYVLGLGAGARVFSRRAPELLAFTVRT